MKPARRPSRRKGWLSSMKGPASRGAKSSFLQWIVVTPLLALLVTGIAGFIYVSYINPRLARGEHAVWTEVLDRVEKTLPDGTLDLAHSHLLVRIDGHELRLRPVLPDWNSLRNGDVIEVQVGRSSADGTPIAYSYKRVAPASIGSP